MIEPDRAQRRYGATAADDARLREMWTAGARRARIAEALGVSTRTIDLRARRLGLAPRRGGPRLPTRQDEMLREMWRDGVRSERIAEALGIHLKTVSRRARAMGLPSRETRAPPAVEEALLRRLYAEGASFSTMAKALGISGSGVWRRARRLGLPPRGAVVRIAPNARVWTPERSAALVEMWERGVPAVEIAIACGVTPRAVKSRAERVGAHRPCPLPREHKPRPPRKRRTAPAVKAAPPPAPRRPPPQLDAAAIAARLRALDPTRIPLPTAAEHATAAAAVDARLERARAALRDGRAEPAAIASSCRISLRDAFRLAAEIRRERAAGAG